MNRNVKASKRSGFPSLHPGRVDETATASQPDVAAHEMTLSFSPTWFNDKNFGEGFTLNVDLLLPDTTGAKQGFRVRWVLSSANIRIASVNLELPPGSETHAHIEAGYQAWDGKMIVYLQDYFSSASRQILIDDVPAIGTVRILPAVLGNGKPVRPIAAGVTVDYFDTDSSGVSQQSRVTLAPMPY